jgi:7-cyano-7-deazaguanine synthase
VSVGPRAVVLLSGGLDSAVALAIAREQGRECHAVSFDYGQRHRAELRAAAVVAQSLGARSHRVVEIGLRAIGGSALTDDIPVPEAGGEGVPVTYVPARNLVFLSVAAGLAETLGAEELYIGANVVDYSGYPDCRPEFLSAFEQAARLGTVAGTAGRGLSVRSPLLHWDKPAIIREGMRLGVDFGLTRSCYDPAPDGGACGRCDSCAIRARAFAAVGLPDPAPGTG